MEGRFDWGRYDFGTFRRRDVFTMGRFDCKAHRQYSTERALRRLTRRKPNSPRRVHICTVGDENDEQVVLFRARDRDWC